MIVFCRQSRSRRKEGSVFQCAFFFHYWMTWLSNLPADILKETAEQCILGNGSKVAFIPMEICVAEFLNRRNTEKVSLSCMDFHNGFSPEKSQSRYWSKVVCFWLAGEVFFSDFCTFGETFEKLPKQPERCMRYIHTKTDRFSSALLQCSYF